MKELIGQELEYVIKKTDDKTVMYIGGQSSFIFVGNKETYEKDIEKISKRLIEAAKRLREKNMNYMETLVGKLFDPMSGEKEISETKIKLKGCYENVNGLKKYIQNFKPVMYRRVIDMYPRIQNDGIIIIIEGKEIGKYWTRKEYDEEKK